MITGCSDRLTSQRRRRLRPSWIPAVLVLGLFYGCQSTPRAGDSDRLLREARLHLEQNNYDYALIKTDAYLQQPWGDKPEEDLALSMAAYASLKMGRTTQSLEYVGALRERFPDSRYNNDQLDRLEANAEQALAAENATRVQRFEQLRAETAALETAIDENPNNAESHIRLGNLYWRAGQYQDALDRYQAGVDLDEGMLQDKQLRKRIKIDDRGQLALKDHPVIGQQSGPLKVTNLHVQRDTRRSIRGERPDRHRYIITGQIANEDIRDHRNVRIEIMLYDFFENLIDVRQMGLGSVPAGGRRAFFADMSSFAGDEFGVNRYEISVYTGNQRTGGAVGH